MKPLIIVALAVLVSACKPTQDQIQRVTQGLPSGCTVHDLGDYGEIEELVVVTCDGRATATSNFNIRQGKVTHQYASASLQ